MRIGKSFLDPRLHRTCDLGSNGRRCLVIEIDHAAVRFARAAMRHHSETNCSVSRSVVEGPKLTLITERTIPLGKPMAASTWLCFIDPDEQALPADTEMPARSSCTS